MKKNIKIKNITRNCSLSICNINDKDFSYILEPGEEKYIKNIEEWKSLNKVSKYVRKIYI